MVCCVNQTTSSPSTFVRLLIFSLCGSDVARFCEGDVVFIDANVLIRKVH